MDEYTKILIQENLFMLFMWLLGVVVGYSISCR